MKLYIFPKSIMKMHISVCKKIKCKVYILTHSTLCLAFHSIIHISISQITLSFGVSGVHPGQAVRTRLVRQITINAHTHTANQIRVTN